MDRHTANSLANLSPASPSIGQALDKIFNPFWTFTCPNRMTGADTGFRKGGGSG